ncbi:FAD-dependent oxidoreductase [Candidatus Nomurabacteria bacterium]|nr:FAD-dependent oxidoreductase [Candidatus Nomurabacteria bacterium]USN95013.1 MAG: FAD-dependent oxidoreductase [Candidatus Nomurabacteria bacterium]
MENKTYELTIIGGGPAGVSGAVYAARKRIKTALITPEFGGQSSVSEKIENWIGDIAVSGFELAERLRKHAESYKGEYLDIVNGEIVEKISKNGGNFSLKLSSGKEIVSKSILIASGSGRRKLPAKGADVFENKGIVYCASCDGPLFADKDVVVVGGGNAAFETAAQLLAYCKSVTLINRGEDFRADEITVEKVLKDPKMKVLKNSEITEVMGEIFVNKITVKNTSSGEESTLDVEGVFVEIGQIPNTGFASDVLELDQYGRITIDPWSNKTSTEGIWAAGDCSNILYHQNNIAAGDAVKALEDIYLWLHNTK